MKPIARGWILHKPDPGLVKQETYEIDRLAAAAPENGYEVEVVSPDDVGLLVSSAKGPSVFLRGEETELPDFVIPRMGSTTTYFAMAILRQLERLGVYCLNGSAAVELAQDVVAIELLCATEALEYQRPLVSGSGVEQAHALVREVVPKLDADRPPSPVAP